jgi:hypothetical protein
MKVRHIRRKPWLRKGPEHRAWKRWICSQRRQREHQQRLIELACSLYMRPVYIPLTHGEFTVECGE